MAFKPTDLVEALQPFNPRDVFTTTTIHYPNKWLTHNLNFAVCPWMVHVGCLMFDDRSALCQSLKATSFVGEEGFPSGGWAPFGEGECSEACFKRMLLTPSVVNISWLLHIFLVVGFALNKMRGNGEEIVLPKTEGKGFKTQPALFQSCALWVTGPRVDFTERHRYHLSHVRCVVVCWPSRLQGIGLSGFQQAHRNEDHRTHQDHLSTKESKNAIHTSLISIHKTNKKDKQKEKTNKTKTKKNNPSTSAPLSQAPSAGARSDPEDELLKLRLREAVENAAPWAATGRERRGGP